MGLIECRKHGASGFSQRISKGIVSKINSNVALRDEDLRVIEFKLYDDEEYLFSEFFLVEVSDFEIFNLDEVVKATTEEEYDKYYAKLPEMDGLCFRCLQDYKKEHNIKMLDFN